MCKECEQVQKCKSCRVNMCLKSDIEYSVELCPSSVYQYIVVDILQYTGRAVVKNMLFKMMVHRERIIQTENREHE